MTEQAGRTMDSHADLKTLSLKFPRTPQASRQIKS